MAKEHPFSKPNNQSAIESAATTKAATAAKTKAKSKSNNNAVKGADNADNAAEWSPSAIWDLFAVPRSVCLYIHVSLYRFSYFLSHYYALQLRGPRVHQHDLANRAVLPRPRLLWFTYALSSQRLVCFVICLFGCLLLCLICVFLCRNLLFFGRKHWFLLPPRHSFYSKQHIHTWVRDSYPALKVPSFSLPPSQPSRLCLSAFLPVSLSHSLSLCRVQRVRWSAYKRRAI